MSDTPPAGDPPQEPPAPETPPEGPPPATVSETPPPATPAAQDDLATVAAEFRAVVGDLRGALDGLRQPSPPSPGAPAVVTPASPPDARRDPRSWLQRAWFGKRRVMW